MNQSGGVVDTGTVAIIAFIAISLILFFWLWVVWVVIRLVKRLKKKHTRLNDNQIASDKVQSAPASSAGEPVAIELSKQPNAGIHKDYRTQVAARHPATFADVLTPYSPIESRVKQYTYTKKEYIMTTSERIFYRQLFRAIGRDYLIFPQIHLSSLLRHQIQHQSWQGALSKIQRKSVDYVLCDTEFRILCAIELDDKTHARSDRQGRDIFVNHIFNEAGLPLVRLPTTSHYSDDELSDIIRASMAT